MKILIELVEVDEIGYDIYLDNEDDPVNLGDVAYFDKKPFRQDVINWLSKKGV